MRYMNMPEDDAEDGCCMCELCWKYGSHYSAPIFQTIIFKIKVWWFNKLRGCDERRSS
jgi:hypothetical protein